LTGKLNVAKEVTNEAIAENIDPHLIINNYMSRAMEDIGKRFEEGKAFVPELLMAARAMKGALDLLKPQMKGAASHSLGKVVIGTVKGDLHDIGKNLVASMLEGCGFEVINLGTDISSEKFINALKENQAQILCLSALLTTTMNYMQEVIKALEENGLRSQVKVMVGGAPVSESFARQIGADGYSDNANAAVTLAKSLLSA
jgi:corrinoid protein of di/trimethylamine methyltransferase